MDDRALAYVPQQAFGVCSFSTLRMVEEVGMPKIISNELLARVPFLEDMVWDPVECGVQPNGRALYFTQLPTEMNRVERTGDVLFGLILPIGNEDKVKNFIIGELDLKSQNPNWKVLQNQSPIFIPFITKKLMFQSAWMQVVSFYFLHGGRIVLIQTFWMRK